MKDIGSTFWDSVLKELVEIDRGDTMLWNWYYLPEKGVKVYLA